MNTICDSKRAELRVIVNDDSEAQRLITLFDCARNVYDKHDEAAILSVLNSVLLYGIDSKLITSLEDLRLYSYVEMIRG